MNQSFGSVGQKGRSFKLTAETLAKPNVDKGGGASIIPQTEVSGGSAHSESDIVWQRRGHQCKRVVFS